MIGAPRCGDQWSLYQRYTVHERAFFFFVFSSQILIVFTDVNSKKKKTLCLLERVQDELTFIPCVQNASAQH